MQKMSQENKNIQKKINDLNPADYNPRIITKVEFDGLKKSIQEFGDISGVVFNRRTGNLVSGHQRREAFINLSKNDLDITIHTEFNESTPQGTVAIGSFFFEGEPFSYREVDWDLKREKKANIVANNFHIHGKYDQNLLPELLLELEGDDDYMELRLDQLEPLDLSEPEELEGQEIEEATDIKKVTLTLSLEQYETFEHAVGVFLDNNDNEGLKKTEKQALAIDTFCRLYLSDKEE